MKKAKAETSALTKKEKKKSRNCTILESLRVCCISQLIGDLIIYVLILESLTCKTSFEVTCRDYFCWARLKSFVDSYPSRPPHLLIGVGEDTVMQKVAAGVRGEGFSQIHHLVGWCSFFTYSLPTVLARANGHEFWWWLPTVLTL